LVSNLRRQWNELSLDKKLAILSPLLIAAVAGVTVPIVLASCGGPPKPPSRLIATIKNVTVVTDVTLADFSARFETAVARPAGPNPTRNSLIVSRKTGDTTFAASTRPFAQLTVDALTSLLQPSDTDHDGIPDDRDQCDTQPAPNTSNGCPAPALDTDQDGIPDDRDQCDTQPAPNTSNGCPAPALDTDQDGIPDERDQCDTQPAPNTSNGCPAPALDTDQDGIPDDRDQCDTQPAPNTSNGCPGTALDTDQDGIPDDRDQCPTKRGLVNGCPFIALVVVGDCKASELKKALRAREQAYGEGPKAGCTTVSDLAQGTSGGASENPAQKKKAIVTVMRATRTRIGPNGQPEAVGVAVSFDVTLEGFKGRRAEVHWTLYREHGGPVRHAWLIDHRVLRLKGERDTDMASSDFWIPLPKLRGPYYVRIGVYDERGTRMTYERTRSFG
jgi:Thrombospondin type 3 repeat